MYTHIRILSLLPRFLRSSRKYQIPQKYQPLNILNILNRIYSQTLLHSDTRMYVHAYTQIGDNKNDTKRGGGKKGKRKEKGGQKSSRNEMMIYGREVADWRLAESGGGSGCSGGSSRCSGGDSGCSGGGSARNREVGGNSPQAASQPLLIYGVETKLARLSRRLAAPKESGS